MTTQKRIQKPWHNIGILAPSLPTICSAATDNTRRGSWGGCRSKE